MDVSLQHQLVLPLLHEKLSGSSQGDLTLAFHSGVKLLLLSLLAFLPACSILLRNQGKVDSSSHGDGEETSVTSLRCQSVLSVRRVYMAGSFLFIPVPSPGHGHTRSYSPSNMAGPTPTIMIDMGSEEACGEEWLE